MSPSTVAKTAMPIPLDELPPGKVHDLFRDPIPDSKDCPFDDIPEQSCSTTSKQTTSAHSEFKNRSAKNSSKHTNSMMNGSRKNNKAKANHNQGNANGILYAADTVEEFNNKKMGVVTRSISRLRCLEKGMM
uniref:Uncharacterized protein n=1 Tax=Rhizophora mucronata TaxID=61149 RepID=A0A2P2JEV0_RHIMU